MSARWVKARFPVAMPIGPTFVDGWRRDGLGLHPTLGANGWTSRDYFTLTHLGSGHGVATLPGPLASARATATRVVKAADWTFNELPRAGSKKLRDLKIATEMAMFGDPSVMLGCGTGARSHKTARDVRAESTPHPNTHMGEEG